MTQAATDENRKIAELVLGLAGSTYGDLRKLENGITSQTGNLKATSDSIKKNIDDFVRGVKPNAALDPAANIPMPVIPGVTTWSPQVSPVQPLAPAAPEQIVSQSARPNPTDQLEFDFDKRAKYEDIYAELCEIKTIVTQLVEEVKMLRSQKKT